MLVYKKTCQTHFASEKIKVVNVRFAFMMLFFVKQHTNFFLFIMKVIQICKYMRESRLHDKVFIFLGELKLKQKSVTVCFLSSVCLLVIALSHTRKNHTRLQTQTTALVLQTKHNASLDCDLTLGCTVRSDRKHLTPQGLSDPLGTSQYCWTSCRDGGNEKSKAMSNVTKTFVRGNKAGRKKKRKNKQRVF